MVVVLVTPVFFIGFVRTALICPTTRFRKTQTTSPPLAPNDISVEAQLAETPGDTWKHRRSVMLADTIAIQKVRRGSLNEIKGCRGNERLLRGSYIENVTLVVTVLRWYAGSPWRPRRIWFRSTHLNNTRPSMSTLSLIHI